jgi:hypothetical protein
VGDDMAVIEGEEDLDEDGLGKSYLVLRRSCFVSRYATFTCPCTPFGSYLYWYHISA